MCYNCGCGMPNDDMGKGKIAKGGGSLTEDDFKHMAEKWKMSAEEAKKILYRRFKSKSNDTV